MHARMTLSSVSSPHHVIASVAVLLLGCAVGCARAGRGVPDEGARAPFVVASATPVFDASFAKGRTIAGSGIGGGPNLADDLGSSGPEEWLGPIGGRLDRVDTSEGVRKLASAACDREVRCGRVGDGQRYPTASACVQTVAAELSARMQASACPSGTVATEPVAWCVTSFDRRECDDGGPLWQGQCEPKRFCGSP